MKLVIPKTKNPKAKVQQLIQTMMSMDYQMYIIVVLADGPTEDKHFAQYFIDMHDNQKQGGYNSLILVNIGTQSYQMSIYAVRET